MSPKNVDELAWAMDTLISDPDLARRMGERGRERALLLYDEKLVLERQINAYRLAVKEVKNQWRQE